MDPPNKAISRSIKFVQVNNSKTIEKILNNKVSVSSDETNSLEQHACKYKLDIVQDTNIEDEIQINA